LTADDLELWLDKCFLLDFLISKCALLANEPVFFLSFLALNVYRGTDMKKNIYIIEVSLYSIKIHGKTHRGGALYINGKMIGGTSFTSRSPPSNLRKPIERTCQSRKNAFQKYYDREYMVKVPKVKSSRTIKFRDW
jgi:hypothetical protein